MIVIRQKVFFNYEEFAKKNGQEAADELRKLRNARAASYRSDRKAIETAMKNYKGGNKLEYSIHDLQVKKRKYKI